MKSQAATDITMNRWSSLVARVGIYVGLTKPGVVQLIVVTAVVGMFLATPGFVPVQILIAASAGIGLAAASAAAFNHVLDRRADAIMNRTKSRPLPTSQLAAAHAAQFAFVLLALSMITLVWFVNLLTAILTLTALMGYSVVYTIFLKPKTPQNIVIGGAAGAAPPVLGWTAVTGSVSVDALILFLIIFLWTPPHFWALALYRVEEYAKAGVPMLPVTHGQRYTLTSMLVYCVALSLACLLPFLSGLSGILYLVGAIILNARFVYLALRLRRQYSDALSKQMFRYSIHYLGLLFGLLWLDHYRYWFSQVFG